jgi:mannosidase alpha-like ER degradation enhancer 1
MANFSLTLVDNLDTFVTFNNYSGFEWAVRQTIDYVSFDQDLKPQVRTNFSASFVCLQYGWQVFEITIRGMGALLSAHMFAADKEGRWGFGIPWYNDELLSLAYDLGRRLLPAFGTTTGIPFARVGKWFGAPIPIFVLTKINIIRLTCGTVCQQQKRLKRVSLFDLFRQYYDIDKLQ